MNTHGWTTHPPTADGFYWLVIDPPVGRPCVVEIAGRFVHFASSVEPCNLSEFESLARWYGPIPLPPTEPQPPAQVTDALVHAEVLRLRAALRYMENWDCKGDALQDAYELYHGEGAWEELVSGESRTLPEEQR
jgi:hypothetical protein